MWWLTEAQAVHFFGSMRATEKDSILSQIFHEPDHVADLAYEVVRFKGHGVSPEGEWGVPVSNLETMVLQLKVSFLMHPERTQLFQRQWATLLSPAEQAEGLVRTIYRLGYAFNAYGEVRFPLEDEGDDEDE